MGFDERDNNEFGLRGRPDDHVSYMLYETDTPSGDTRIASYAEATRQPGGKEVINEVIVAGESRRAHVGRNLRSSTRAHSGVCIEAGIRRKNATTMCVLRDTPACAAWLESECYAAMHSLLDDMAAFTMGNVCIAGSFALAMYNRSRDIEVPWRSNDVDVFFLAGGEKQRETLLMIAHAFFQSWMEDSTTITVQSRDGREYSSISHVDETDGEVAAWRLREKLSHMVSKESANNESCAAARTAHTALECRSGNAS